MITISQTGDFPFFFRIVATAVMNFF